MILEADAQRGTRIATSHVPELDGLRGVAILMVVFWHYVCGQMQVQAGSIAAYGLRLMSFSWAGVDLFLVLSGFLIGGSLLDRVGSPRAIRLFLIRRIFRIVPLYFTSAVLFYAFKSAVPAGHGPGWNWLLEQPMPWWSYALFLQNATMAWWGSHGANWLGITWSLALEIQIYVLLAAMIVLTPARLLPTFIVALVISAALLRTGLAIWSPGIGGFAGYLLLPCRMDAPCMGVLIAIIHRRPDCQDLSARLRRSQWPVFAVGGGIVVTLCALGQGIASLGMSVIGHTSIALVGASAILLLATQRHGILQGISRSRPLMALGIWSYGIYLLHQPVSGLMHYFFRDQAPRISTPADGLITLGALCATVILAAVSWRHFERPLIEIGRTLGHRRPVVKMASL